MAEILFLSIFSSSWLINTDVQRYEKIGFVVQFKPYFYIFYYFEGALRLKSDENLIKNLQKAENDVRAIEIFIKILFDFFDLKVQSVALQLRPSGRPES